MQAVNLPDRKRASARTKATPLFIASARSFWTRAALYARLDAQLYLKTRFFGAASITNRVLGDLMRLSALLSWSSETAQWMADCGAVLETANLSMAQAIRRGTVNRPCLDTHLVALEQAIVEHIIGETRPASGAHTRLFVDVDDLLNRGAALALFHFRPEVRWYCRIIAATRTRLGAPIEFSNQQHREAIGIGLVEALRRGARSGPNYGSARGPR